ncbi:MAG: T9SS type A sorting domain-containing protein [Candidatus Marinimicrobia bacterium]|nr:T9SS type A sorting domain-containing protein [Candidatus Neomarinimicrobiota bacterium]
MSWVQTRSNLLIVVTLCFVITTTANSQPQVEFLGLDGKLITSMGMYGSAIIIGTNGDGVFYQYSNNLPDSSWIYVGLEGKNVTAVYPHKSGPFGWGITAGLFPDDEDSNYVYCSFMGDEFVPNSFGISDSLAEGVYQLAGFPDFTICGEKYAATGGALYRQLWGDSTWTPIYESPGDEGSGVIYVRTKENVGGFVLAGGSEGFTGILLIKSFDYGDSWEYIYPPGGVVAFDFDIDSTYSDFGTIFVTHGWEISRSLDGGVNWEIVLNAGGCNYLDEIVYDPLNGRVFAAGGDCLDTTSAILFYSGDMGENWTQIPLNFSGPIKGIGLSWDGYLYMAVPWSGVYRMDLDELSIEETHIPLSFALYPAYPNPFNSTTTIRFSVETRHAVSLHIYNITGRLVETLINKPLTPGEHEITWNAGHLPSGVYFVRLQSGEFIETRKVILMK